MNGNYEWQKFSAKDRSNNYRRQAQENRQIKDSRAGDGRTSLPIKQVGTVFLIAAALFFLGFFLSGCQSGGEVEAAAIAPQNAASSSEVSMQERHLFHDQLSEAAESRRTYASSGSIEMSKSRINRIQFQDKRESSYDWLEQPPNKAGTESLRTMKERHLFHDTLNK